MGKLRYEDYDSLIMGEENSISYISDIRNYELIHLTKAGMVFYGLKSPEDYKGKKCYRLLQGLEEPCPFCTNKLLRCGEKYRWEHFNTKLDRLMQMEDTLILLEGRECRLERAYDITEQRRQVQQLAERLSVEEILVECLHILVREENFDRAFNLFLERLGNFYRANRAYIFEFDLEKKLISNTYEWCAEGVSAEMEHLQNVPIALIDRWIYKFQMEGEFFINALSDDTDPESAEYKILEAQGINSLLAALLYSGDIIVGFIGVDDPSDKQNDFTLLRASAHFIIEELKKRRLIKRLEYESHIDNLTGLYNRNKYMETLHEYEGSFPQALGIVFADVNGMKELNDTYGHKYGDYILIRVAGLLRETGQEKIYRIGGDEFVVLFENVEKEAFHRAVQQLKERIRQDQECNVSAGGIYADGKEDINGLIIRADEKMYAEKQSYYKDILRTGHIRRNGIFSEVAREIKENRFLVFYQPQIDMKTERIIGAEALVRKKDDKGELIVPDHFIQYYEADGVIRHVDLFVLEEVCRAMRSWKQDGIELPVAVNFSRVTLMEEHIIDEILKICRKYDVLPEMLTIEVTESIGKMEHEALRQLVNQLTEKGFTVSLDDFGARYSNMSILSDLNFDTVKIDKSLVEKLEYSEKSQIIMRNTIRMCQEMEQTHSLAEGIETEEQKKLLSSFNCEYGQGFFFSKPLSLEQFNRLLYEKQPCAKEKED